MSALKFACAKSGGGGGVTGSWSSVMMSEKSLSDGPTPNENALAAPIPPALAVLTENENDDAFAVPSVEAPPMPLASTDPGAFANVVARASAIPVNSATPTPEAVPTPD